MYNNINTARFVDSFHVEAHSGCINILCLNNEQIYELKEQVPFIDVVRRLDAGDWDDHLFLGMKIIHKLGYSDYASSAQETLIIWRWLIASLFFLDQKEKNGSIIAPSLKGPEVESAIYIGKSGGMNIFPATERFAMANNIEAALIERYGVEQGTANAINFYIAMRSDDGELSDLGREILSSLHDEFVIQIQEKGIPEWPAEH
ncbi:hypothetical protein [Phytobacter sp. RSE-02]|uniref:hypothetical protein n=1 Tax=Phytobacter sp. RSE-02 TaxID=3229229 RepID=UPI00339D558C